MSINTTKGTWICFEGPDGVGKTTLAQAVVKELNESGTPSVYVREPGGTPVGEKLRSMLKDASLEMSPLTQLFVTEAARAEQMIITQAHLSIGTWVIQDRYTPSSIAYRPSIAPHAIVEMQRLFGIPEPDYYFFMDADQSLLDERTMGRDTTTDRFESQSYYTIMQRTKLYRDLATAFWGVRINANASADKVFGTTMLEINRIRLLKGWVNG